MASCATRKHAGDDNCDEESHYSSVAGVYDFKVVARDGGNTGDTIHVMIWLHNSANPADDSRKVYDNGQDSPLIRGKIVVKVD